jgi:DeoR/GlpR family transcriptional regulator of sugar metabolism
MFAAARQQQIKELLLKYKQMNVATLAETLGVTEVTIRRDLDKLEKDYTITKTHGGAILNESTKKNHEHSFVNNISLKIREIGENAALLINNREAIFIGCGITCLQVAANLKNKQRIIVMTNDLKVGDELSNTPDVISVVTGGNILPGTSILVGDLAMRALEDVHFNKFIVSAEGISFSHGLTTNTTEESMIYKKLMTISDELIIVADYSKFDRIGFSSFGKLLDIHKLVTNKEVDDKYKEFFFQNNIKVYTPYEVEELTVSSPLGAERYE